METTERPVILHGDMNLIPCEEAIPDDAPTSDTKVIQQSDVTRNRHEIRCKEMKGWNIGEKVFVHLPTNGEIDHIGPESEHGCVEVLAGTYEVTHQEEYDAISKELRSVID